jgi:hypothetical protein
MDIVLAVSLVWLIPVALMLLLLPVAALLGLGARSRTTSRPTTSP